MVKDFVGAGTIGVATVPDDSYDARRAWYMLIVFQIQILASGIDLAIVTLLVHPVEIAFRINDVGFAAITAVPVGIGTAIAYYPAGLLADTFRRRDMIVGGAVIWTLGALVAARADSVPMLFLARLLAGIGTGVPVPAIISMFSDAFPRTRRAFATSIYSAGIAIGAGVGLTICGALVAATQRNGMAHVSGMLLSPWQQCFIAVAAMGIIALVLILTVPEPPRRGRATLANANLTSSLRTFRRYLQQHGLLWIFLLLGYAIGGTSYYGVAAWVPTLGMRHYGITGVSSIALLGVFAAGGSLLGSIGGGFLAQHGLNHGQSRIVPRMLVAVAVLSCIFAVGFPFMPSWLLAVVGAGSVDATVQASLVLMIIAIQETVPNEARGQLVGLLGFIAFIPSVLGGTLVAFLASGIFAKAGDLGPALAVVGGITSMLAALLYIFCGNPYERARHEMRTFDTSP